VTRRPATFMPHRTKVLGRLSRRFNRRAAAFLVFMMIALPTLAAGQATNALRTATAPGAGTAVIRGRVTASDTGRPLRRATVTVASADAGTVRRTMSTTADGRYEIDSLPAGLYTISAWRNGYLAWRYGQSRPFEAAKPLLVADKTAIEKLDLVLPKMSVVAGRVVSETGEPLADVHVLLMRQVYVDGGRRYGVADYGSTDDAGRYRLVSVAPGTYIVMATLSQTWTVIEGGEEQAVGYAPTYYPGTPAAQSARRITVGVGQTLDNISFAMARGAVASISGTAIGSRGQSLAGETVYLSQPFVNGGSNAAFQHSGTLVGADGSFVVRNVPPGDYKLVLRQTVRDADGAHVEEAGVLPIAVNGVDVRDVVFTSSRGGQFDGQVLTEPGTLADLPRDAIKIVAQPLLEDADQKVGGSDIDSSGLVREDGTFHVRGVFGRARIRATLPDGWVLKTVLRNGRDVTDEPFELRSREQVSGIEIIVSHRVTEVSGRLTADRRGQPAEGTVIVYPQDAERWGDLSRYARAVRPDQQGRFEVKALPPGDYLAVAVSFVEGDEWRDSAYLESIRRHGQRVRLTEDSVQTVSLMPVTP